MTTASDKIKTVEFAVSFYEPDNEWVAEVEYMSEFSGMNWMDKDPVKALEGLIKLIQEEIKLDEKEKIK